MKKLFAFLLISCFVVSFSLPVNAENPQTAKDITDKASFSGTGYSDFDFLSDKNIDRFKTSNGNTEILIESAENIYNLYLLFDLEYGEYTVTDNVSGEIINAGKEGFLHEYIKLSTPTTSLTLSFNEGKVSLSEIYLFSDGDKNSVVQDWKSPLDNKADIVLFSAHGDDDQLFFAGLLPKYAYEMGLNVQVVYMTDHRNLTNERTHEMLNGLWSVGVTAYPVFGRFDDFLIKSMEGTYERYEDKGISREDLLNFVVTQIRRFKPLVTVAHDFNGEYGHGMHMVYADCVSKALELTNDSAHHPESYEKYGGWDVKKAYFHLYEENQIVIDYDFTLSDNSGMTAFQMSQQKGYPCHKSQQYTWFTKWINKSGGEDVTSATQIKTYNPCEFGLYKSLVGEDIKKDDFMENIVSYKEQERIEQEKLALEEAEKQKEEQLIKEELLKKEDEEKQKAEQTLLENNEKIENQKKTSFAVLIAVITVTLITAILVLSRLFKKR